MAWQFDRSDKETPPPLNGENFRGSLKKFASCPSMTIGGQAHVVLGWGSKLGTDVPMTRDTMYITSNLSAVYTLA